MGFVRKDVVIVGGGFSGTMLAVHLLRRASNLSLAVIDESTTPARGLAYSSPHDCHLLNVPAKDMSAFASEPSHFLDWATLNADRPVQPTSFLPRTLYGRYVGAILRDAADQAHYSRNNFDWIRDRAVSIDNAADGAIVHRANGAPIQAQAVVLALGNFPPGNLGIRGLRSDARHYHRLAWTPDALAGLSSEDSVLLIGSGLTSVDISLALHSRGFRGPIHVLSRHGLLPLAHQCGSCWPGFWDETSPRTARALMRLIRAEVANAAAAGTDWRAVIDSLRPHLQQIWQSLPLDERRRFLRHARPYWEIHRHRIAPEVAEEFSRMLSSGQLRVHAGRILSYSENEKSAAVIFHNRKTDAPQQLQVTRVINCSGPQTDYRKIEDPLLASLFARKLVRQDSLGLGLDFDQNGKLRDSSGHPSTRLYGIGPVRKGDLWESTAVPELRGQAADLAQWLLSNNFRQHPLTAAEHAVSSK